MKSMHWFLFFAGTGLVVGLALLFEPHVAGGTIGLGDGVVR